MKSRSFLLLTLVILVGSFFVLAGCTTATNPAGEPAADEEHMEEGEEHGHSPEEHMAGAHDVPEEAAAVSNPTEATDESIDAGAQTFAENCAVCHGENGHGDGPSAESLETQPADLTAGHVQELSDGALFYIVTHGRPESPMPAWEGTLSEEQRWDVVNFLHTLDDHHEDDHEDEHQDEHEEDDHGHEDEAHHENEDHHEDEDHHGDDNLGS